MEYIMLLYVLESHPKVGENMPKLKKTTIEIKDLRPKDLLGLKGYGPEPEVPAEYKSDTERTAFLGKALNWYNYFYSNKDAKQFIVGFLNLNNESTLAKQLNKVPDNRVVPTLGWMCRLSQRGFDLSKEEQERIFNEANRVIATLTVEEDSDPSETKEETAKRNVQQVMRERAQDVAGELQGLYDEFITRGCEIFDTANQVVNSLSEKNILPQHISIVIGPWVDLKEELIEVQRKTDEDLNEAYAYLSVSQLKKAIKFIDQVISNINSYVAVKQTNRVKRAKKPVSVEKQVSKLKYLRKFSDPKNKLELVSVEPTKLHNSSEAWIYDTAKRKLHHYVADDISKCLLVKGNKLLGFDTKQSEVKTLRKPGEQIKQIMGSKPAARKFFKDIRAVVTIPNGRFNPNMIILRAF